MNFCDNLHEMTIQALNADKRSAIRAVNLYYEQYYNDDTEFKHLILVDDEHVKLIHACGRQTKRFHECIDYEAICQVVERFHDDGKLTDLINILLEEDC